MGIKATVTFDEYCNFYKNCIGWNEKNAEEEYRIYTKQIEKENECYKKTRHRNQRYGLGMFFCEDCGADL